MLLSKRSIQVLMQNVEDHFNATKRKVTWRTNRDPNRSKASDRNKLKASEDREGWNAAPVSSSLVQVRTASCSTSAQQVALAAWCVTKSAGALNLSGSSLAFRHDLSRKAAFQSIRKVTQAEIRRICYAWIIGECNGGKTTLF